MTDIFKDFDRLLQRHLDFFLMSALIFGFYAAKAPLPWHVRWSMVIGAFTNSSLFLMQSMFPVSWMRHQMECFQWHSGSF